MSISALTVERSHIYSLLSCFKNNYIFLVSWGNRKIRSIIHAIKFNLLNRILVIWDLHSTFIYSFYRYLYNLFSAEERWWVISWVLDINYHIFQVAPNVTSYMAQINGNLLFFSFIFILLTDTLPSPHLQLFTKYLLIAKCFCFLISWMMHMSWKESTIWTESPWPLP